jgi:chorismate synthase
MGVVIDGCPAGLDFDENLLANNLKRRKPGQAGTTTRQESDQPEILSGVFAGKTLGTPIAVVVRNKDQKSSDYSTVKAQPRVGHADDLWAGKFGHWDYRGGGRASARETLNWVIAGSVAEMFCRVQHQGLQVQARLLQVGGETVSGVDDPRLQKRLNQAQQEGQSYGAKVGVTLLGVPPFVGEPVFLKLKSELARAFMLINACCWVELGDGFAMASQAGQDIHKSHHSPAYGGVRGGISTGEELRFQLALKPTSSIRDTAKQGRHDPCVALRALPVVEAMAWNVLADLVLAQRLNRIS